MALRQITSGAMQSLVQGCHLMAGGIDLAADGVVAINPAGTWACPWKRLQSRT